MRGHQAGLALQRRFSDQGPIGLEKWYASLSKEERKKYDFEQKELRKKAITDSIRLVKEEQQAIKDSITKNTPRILDTYAVSDSMHYRRIISWTADRDFQELNVSIPDSSYNYHFYDYDFQRKDVNATWLGVAGSPVQHYNFFLRNTRGTGFWDSYSAWSYSPQTFRQYNTKTPHTELAYFGTLLSDDAKESDNVHFLTTQNITPAFNFSILYDKWGGGGMLINEKTSNSTLGLGVNYLGKKYLMNAVHKQQHYYGRERRYHRHQRDQGHHHRPSRGKGGYDFRFVGDQKDYLLCRPAAPHSFQFHKRHTQVERQHLYGERRHHDRFIGHALELNRFGRKFSESSTSADSLGRWNMDNKLYIRLQPWKQESLISKIDIGLGDEYNSYHNVTATDTSSVHENTVYTYAGASGKLGKWFDWQAKTHYGFIGTGAGDFDISANFKTRVYPFRKAKTSPLEISGELSSSLLKPEFYQRHFYSTINEMLRWDKDLNRISTTKIKGNINIPHWRFSLDGGYAIVNNYTYYDTFGVLQQHGEPSLS